MIEHGIKVVKVVGDHYHSCVMPVGEGWYGVEYKLGEYSTSEFPMMYFGRGVGTYDIISFLERLEAKRPQEIFSLAAISAIDPYRVQSVFYEMRRNREEMRELWFGRFYSIRYLTTSAPEFTYGSRQIQLDSILYRTDKMFSVALVSEYVKHLNKKESL